MRSAETADVVRKDVFLSYAREDSAFVQRLHIALERAGISVWVDERSIPTSATFLDEIYAGIESAAIFMAVLSPASVESRFCRLEADHAAEHDKRLVPIEHREVEPSRVHPALAACNWQRFHAADDFDERVRECTEVIRADLDYDRQAAKYLQWALEWQLGGNLLAGEALAAAEIWLEDSADKDPFPTLQASYIRESRSRRARFVKRTTATVTASFLVVVVLFLGWRRVAERRSAIDEFLSADGALVWSPIDVARKESLREQLSECERFPAYTSGVARIQERLARLPVDRARQVVLAESPLPLAFAIASDASEFAVGYPERIEVRSARGGTKTYDPKRIPGRSAAEVIWMDAGFAHDFFLFEVRYEHFARPVEGIHYDHHKQAYYSESGELVRGNEQEIFCGFFDGSPPFSLGRSQVLEWGTQADAGGEEHGGDLYYVDRRQTEVTRRQALDLRIDAGALAAMRSATPDADIPDSIGVASRSRETHRLRAALLKRFDAEIAPFYDEVQSYRGEDRAATTVREIARNRGRSVYHVEECVLPLFGRPGGFAIYPLIVEPQRKPRRLLPQVLYHERAELLSFPGSANDFVSQKPSFEPCAIDDDERLIVVRDRLITVGAATPPETLAGLDADGLRDVAFGAEGSLLLFNRDRSVEVYDLRARCVAHRFRTPLDERYPLRVARSANRVLVLEARGATCNLVLWDLSAFGPDGWGAGALAVPARTGIDVRPGPDRGCSTSDELTSANAPGLIDTVRAPLPKSQPLEARWRERRGQGVAELSGFAWGMIAALDDPDHQVRTAAMDSLIDRLRARRSIRGAEATDRAPLGALLEPLLGHLPGALESEWPDEIRAALGLARAMGTPAAPLGPAIVQVLRRSDSGRRGTRSDAIETLEQIGAVAPAEASAIADVLREASPLARFVVGPDARPAAMSFFVRHLEAARAHVDVLESYSRATDEKLRVQAIQLLTDLGRFLPEVEVGLWDAVESQDGLPHKLRHVLDAYLRRPGSDRERLLALLSSADASMRESAIELAEVFGGCDDELLMAVARLVGDEDPDVRQRAVQVLESAPAIPRHLLEAIAVHLSSESRSIRYDGIRAMHAVAAVEGTHVRRFREDLESGDADVRRECLQLLRVLGPAASCHAQGVASLLAEDDLRYIALLALHDIGPEARPQAGAIIEVIDQFGEYELDNVFRALARLGYGDDELISVFVRVSQLPVGSQAIASYLRHQDVEQRAVRLLPRMFAHTEARIRGVARLVIAEEGIALKSMRPVFEELLRSRPSDASALWAYLQLSRNQQPPWKRARIDQMYDLDLAPKLLIALLAPQAESQAKSLAVLACRALGSRAGELWPHLLGIVRDTDASADLRSQAMSGLVDVGEGDRLREVRELIVDLMRASDESAVRIRCLIHLAAIGTRFDPEEVRALTSRLGANDADMDEQYWAIRALVSLGEIPNLTGQQLVTLVDADRRFDTNPIRWVFDHDDGARLYAPRMTALLRSSAHRQFVVSAFEHLGERGASEAPQIVALLRAGDEDLSESCLRALQAMPDAARGHLGAIFDAMKRTPGNRELIALLDAMRPLTMAEILTIAERAEGVHIGVPEMRHLLYGGGGENADVAIVLRYVGRPLRPAAPIGSREEGLATLGVLSRALDQAADLVNTRRELGRAIATRVRDGAEAGYWRESDRESLRGLYEVVRRHEPLYAPAMEEAISPLPTRGR